MTELLAPAGNMDALKAAVSNGCDAVYLGMTRFGARAYSSNFDENTLREAIEYCHLRDVKVYVTMNTIVFEDEIEDMHSQLKLINQLGVDGVIVQDLAVLDYIVNNFEDMDAHCSTQMGIDDLEGTLLFKNMGAKRVVLARETDVDEAIAIRETSGVPVEVFVHGALCVSYSGNCLMSGLIGYRSGNRGRCVGSCRKLYELINTTTGKSLGQSYILSMKDLNTFDQLDRLKVLDSLKIEGRMKEPAYVANVVSIYRSALDGNSQDGADLEKTFNRTYTKGYILGEDRADVVNVKRPNNYGYPIGRITGISRGRYEITLDKVLNQNDIIRIDHQGEDVNLSVVKLYGLDGRLINSAEDKCFISVKEKLSLGDVVYKTKDYQYYKGLGNALDGEFRRFPLDVRVYAYPGTKLVIEAEGLGCSYLYESEEILGEAIKAPTSAEQVAKQLGRLGDTVFVLGNVEFEEYNAFIPVKLLNSARREIVDGLCEARIGSKPRKMRTPETKASIAFPVKDPYITASVTTEEQYRACREMGIDVIYYDNIVPRNNNKYKDMEGQLLIGGYGGIYRYKDTNPFVTDYSLNVVNAESCRILHGLGAARVTISYELNRKQIRQLIDSYYEANGGYPALEMIVYGRAPLLVTRYCPLKTCGLCGECRRNSYELRDEYGTFPLVSHEDCTTTVLNGKVLNLLDEMPFIEGIEAFRLNFTLETAEEVKNVIHTARAKLDGEMPESVFDSQTDTRGHFNKEII